MTLTQALAWAGAGLAAFLLGSVNPATMIARLLGKELSTSGSGNPGATNAGRVLGRKWGILVGLLDVLKGYVPVLLAAMWSGEALAYVVGVAAVLGHVWSPFLRGRGGKGAATALGAVLGVQPWLAVLVLAGFGVGAVVGHSIALGSVVGALGMLVTAGFVLAGVLPGGLITVAWLVALAGIVLGRHKANVLGWWRAWRLSRS